MSYIYCLSLEVFFKQILSFANIGRAEFWRKQISGEVFLLSSKNFFLHWAVFHYFNSIIYHSYS